MHSTGGYMSYVAGTSKYYQDIHPDDVGMAGDPADVGHAPVHVYVSLKPGFEASDEMAAKVSKAIESEIGKIARPKNVWIVPDMPKTRSGKIMRRVIASISNFADVGDVTTLANPEIVDDIRHDVQSVKVARDDVPRNLTEGRVRGDQEVRRRVAGSVNPHDLGVTRPVFPQRGSAIDRTFGLMRGC